MVNNQVEFPNHSDDGRGKKVNKEKEEKNKKHNEKKNQVQGSITLKALTINSEHLRMQRSLSIASLLSNGSVR